MQIEQKLFPCCFSATTRRNSTKLNWNLYNTKTRCAYHSIDPVRSYNTELWLLISYAVCILSNNRFRAISLQLQAGIQWNLMETINSKRRWAYPCLVPVRPFNTDLWPMISYMYVECIKSNFAIALQLLYWFQQNFMETINTKRQLDLIYWHVQIILF
jgi:hypothetical protein